MEIKNKTEWNTKDLMKLIRAVAKKEGISLKKHIIEIIHSKNSDGYARITGFASVGRGTVTAHAWDGSVIDDAEFGNGRWVKMRVPPYVQTKWLNGSDGKWSKVKEAVPFDSIKFARVLTHEFGHNMGLRHREMCNSSDIDCDWAKEFIVNPKGV